MIILRRVLEPVFYCLQESPPAMLQPLRRTVPGIKSAVVSIPPAAVSLTVPPYTLAQVGSKQLLLCAGEEPAHGLRAQGEAHRDTVSSQNALLLNQRATPVSECSCVEASDVQVHQPHGQ